MAAAKPVDDSLRGDKGEPDDVGLPEEERGRAELGEHVVGFRIPEPRARIWTYECRATVLPPEGVSPSEEDPDDAREVGVEQPGPPAQHRHQRDDEPFPRGSLPHVVRGGRAVCVDEEEQGRVQEREREGQDEVGRAEGGDGARVEGKAVVEERYISLQVGQKRRYKVPGRGGSRQRRKERQQWGDSFTVRAGWSRRGSNRTSVRYSTPAPEARERSRPGRENVYAFSRADAPRSRRRRDGPCTVQGRAS